MLRITQNVGQNKQMAADLESELRAIALEFADSFSFVMCRPGARKWSRAAMIGIAGWHSRCSQHARDAMKLVVGL